jgi:hypothetical protein
MEPGIGDCEGCCDDARNTDLSLEALPEALKGSVGDLQSFAFGDVDMENLVPNARQRPWVDRDP